jgi:hypothetical protein
LYADQALALSIELTPAHMEKLEGAADFDLGFPLNFINQPGEPNWLTRTSGHYDFPNLEQVRSVNIWRSHAQGGLRAARQALQEGPASPGEGAQL